MNVTAVHAKRHALTRDIAPTTQSQLVSDGGRPPSVGCSPDDGAQLDRRRTAVTRRSPEPIDFRGARRRIDALSEVPSETRHRAFAVWVALFDVADVAEGVYVIERSTHEVAAAVDVSRQSWLEYRDLLERAGLLLIGPSRGPRPQVLILTPPASE
jgi:hypothetical protein